MSRHGKDTVGGVFIENNYTRVAFADKVKERFAQNEGITLEELELNKSIYREGIIKLAEDTKLSKGQDYWVRQIEEEVLQRLNNGENLVITDVRQWYEVDFINRIRNQYSETSLLYVSRPESNGGEFDYDKNTALGISYALYNGHINLVLFNDGEESDLKNQVKHIFKF